MTSTQNRLNVNSKNRNINIINNTKQKDIIFRDTDENEIMRLDGNNNSLKMAEKSSITIRDSNIFINSDRNNELQIEASNHLLLTADSITIEGRKDMTSSILLGNATDRVIINGSLSVNGSQSASLSDPVITLAGNTVTNDGDRGIDFNWYNNISSSVEKGFFGFDI